MLALCWLQDETKKEEAVTAAKQAVGLDPEDAFVRGILALTLANTAKDGQKGKLQLALGEAQQAVRLDPHSDFTHSVEARIQLALRNFPEAEEAARKALQWNTENTNAAQVLSIALLQQHKDEDNSELVRYQLERNPEESSTHTSAGWLALRTGNHKVANQHFLEALRLDPMNEGARLGLVESYRARSVVYRSYIGFGHFMTRFTEGRQTAIMIGGYVAYRVLYNFLRTSFPVAAAVLVAAWLALVLWSHLARGFSSFLMLFDGYARRSLRWREIWEGLAVGGFTVAAFILFAASFRWIPGGEFAAGALLASAVVSAAAFTNDHYWGKHVYDVAAWVAAVCAFYGTLDVVFRLREPLFMPAVLVAITCGAAMTWLRALRIGYA
jgi:tetratricopeptide (TPR) repeat protein